MNKIILSWDVGIKNLAFCKIEFTQNEFKILKWNIINLIEKKINCKKIGINDITTKLYDELDKNIDIYIDADQILIENQPSFKNPKMKTLSILLYSYFILKKKNVNLVAPFKKLSLNQQKTDMELKKGKTKNQIYLLTKKLGKKYCLALLNDNDKKVIMETKKKDDLCDAFLQAFRYVYKIIPEKYIKLLNDVTVD